MSQSNRKQDLHRGSAGDGVLRFIGTMGAIGGVLALTAKVVSDNFEPNSEGFPAAVESQILAGSSQAQDKKECLTLELQVLAKNYRDEMAIQMERGNWERTRWLSETQTIVDTIVNMQRDLDLAVKKADLSSVSALTPKLRKAQQDLLRRLQQDQSMDDTSFPSGSSLEDEKPSSQSTCSSSGADKGVQEQLSREEVKALLETVETKMKNIDTSVPNGLSKWRSLNNEKALYQDMLNCLETTRHSTRYKNQ